MLNFVCEGVCLLLSESQTNGFGWNLIYRLENLLEKTHDITSNKISVT